jgi:hypothetical protein
MPSAHDTKIHKTSLTAPPPRSNLLPLSVVALPCPLPRRTASFLLMLSVVMESSACSICSSPVRLIRSNDLDPGNTGIRSPLYAPTSAVHPAPPIHPHISLESSGTSLEQAQVRSVQTSKSNFFCYTFLLPPCSRLLVTDWFGSRYHCKLQLTWINLVSNQPWIAFGLTW